MHETVTTIAIDDAGALPGRTRGSLGALSAAALLMLLMTAGGLIVYKTSSALNVLAKAQANGTLQPKARWIDSASFSGAARPFVESINYFSWVMIALGFGIVLGAMARAFVPSRWLQRTVAAEGLRGQLVAALIGAPLMLCSCCIVPVFEGVYQRTRRLGPALGLMFAAPALNPAVLAVTFLLFPPAIAWTRLGISVVLVVVGAAGLGHAFPDARPADACPVDTESPSWSGLVRRFGTSLRAVAWRSLPAILLGVVASAAVAGLVPVDAFADWGRGSGALVVIALVALVALPLALPTFGEIPLALALLAAGAPAGAGVALLVAGPAINLASLFTLARVTSWRVATATGLAVLAAALVSGLLVHAVAG